MLDLRRKIAQRIAVANSACCDDFELDFIGLCWVSDNQFEYILAICAFYFV